MSEDPGCKCAFCKNKLKFNFPDHLLKEFESGNVVVFAGAGISTENRDYAIDTLYDRLRNEIGEPGKPSFPQLCQKYCAQPDGRIKLIQNIKDRFDYFKAFSEFFFVMTGFHRALTPLFMVTDVITTNWDDFFETECGFDAFVSDSDLPFWEASRRRVLKIHGSIRNLGSIVATEDDYAASFRRLNSGPLGAMLKTILSQKTIVYVGYSLSDENYIRLATNIARMLKPHIKTSYIVSPTISEKIESFPLPLVPIKTDGSYFLEQLRIHLKDRVGIVEDSAFSRCEILLDKAIEAHFITTEVYSSCRTTLTPFALSYQDGLIHGLKRIRVRRLSGEYHSIHRLGHLIDGYVVKAKEYKGDLWNESYAFGYRNAIMYLLLSSEYKNPPRPPLYGIYGKQEFHSISALTRFPKSKIQRRHSRQAQRIIERCQSSKPQLVPDHTPYL